MCMAHDLQVQLEYDDPLSDDFSLRLNEANRVLMTDKRTKHRDIALKDINLILSKNYIPGTVDISICESLLSTLQTIIARKKTTTDVVGCLDCSVMLCAQYGPDLTNSVSFSSLLEVTHAIFTSLITVVGTTVTKLPFSYAMLHFVSCDLRELNLNIFEDVMSRCRKLPKDFVESAILGWSLLFSVSPKWQVVPDVRRMMKNCLGALLDAQNFSGDTNSVVMRLKTSEMLCLVVERLKDVDQYEHVLMELKCLIDPILSDFWLIPAKNVAKKDRANHRGSLRSLDCLFSTHPPCPLLKLKIRGTCFPIKDWVTFVRYSAFREIFSDVHFEKNDLVHRFLGIEVEQDADMNVTCNRRDKMTSSHLRKCKQKRVSQQRKQDLFMAYNPDEY